MRFALLLIGLVLTSCQKRAADDLKNVNPLLEEVQASDILTMMKKTVAPIKIVNFWATWCQPCVEEFPNFVRIYNEFKPSVEMYFVSMNFSKEHGDVNKFLEKEGVDFKSYIKNESDDVFINTIEKKWKGSIPTTIIYGKDGQQLALFERPMTYEDLKAQVLHYTETANKKNQRSKP